MFEAQACVADWERAGRVPVPARLLAPPDLSELLAEGPPLVDEVPEAEWAAVDGGAPGVTRSPPSGEGGTGGNAGSNGSPGRPPDLDGADLDGADLEGADLEGADLDGVGLGGRGPGDAGSADVVATPDGQFDADDPPVDSAEWAGLAPGLELARLLTTVDVSGLSEFDLVEAVAGWERLAGWVAAEQARVLAELSRRPLFAELSSFRDGIDPVAAVGMEISARLRISHREADTRVVFARELTTDRRATFDALRAGTIDLRRARILVDGVGVLDDAAAAGVEARLLQDAGEHTPQGFRRRVERAVAVADPAGFDDRHERAREDRQVRCRPEPDGMASVWALLPAADAAMVNTVLDAAADGMKHSQPDDPRTHAQRRADALAGLAWAAWHAGHLGGVFGGQRLARGQGRRAEIGVLVPYLTLIGLSEAPGELDGFGPIPASVARRLAAGGTWRRILTDPATGRVLDYGRTRYRPPQDLIDHVIARDRTCRGIGCDRLARSCEIDHTIPYPGGPTAEGNTGPFCDRQHLFKTHGRWQVRQPTPGQFVWRTPTGHTYTKHPDSIGPIIDSHAKDHIDHPPPPDNDPSAASNRSNRPAEPDPPPF